MASGWGAGTNETFVAQSPGTDSPAGDVNACEISALSAGFGRYHLVAGTVYARASYSFWRKQLSASNRRAAVTCTDAAGNGLKETGVVPVTWEKVVLANTFSAPAGGMYFIPLYGGNAYPRGAPYANEACSGKFDFHMVETGTSISHEFYDGNRLGTVMSVPVSAALSVGRLNFYTKLRPKGSFNGTNNWTYNPYVWYIDANNYCLISTTTGQVTVCLAGATWTTPMGIAVARADLLEIWTECGNGTTRVSVRKNSGSIIELGQDLTTRAAISSSGTLGLLCRHDVATTGQLESWVELIQTYKTGAYPPDFRPDGAVILYGIDFTIIDPVNPATPAGFTSVCATVGRFVKTGTSTVKPNVAADILTIGKWIDAHNYGWSFEGPVANIVPNPRTRTGWTAEANLVETQDQTGPDGAANTAWREFDTPPAGRSKYTVLTVTGSTNYCMSNWGRTAATAYFRGLSYKATGPAICYDPGEAGHIAMTAAWSMSVQTGQTAATVGTTAFMPQGNYAYSGYTTAETTETDAIVDMPQFELGLIPHDFVIGTKLGSSGAVQASTNVYNGRIQMYSKIRLKGSITTTTNLYRWDPWVFYQDANNNCKITAATGVITFTVNGISWTTPLGIIASRLDVLELWVECGNGYNRAVIRINGGTIIDLGQSMGAYAALANTGTISTLCNAADVTTGQLESWVENITFYEPGTYLTGFAPIVTPVPTFNADFTVQAGGAGTAPAGSTYLSASNSQSVKISDTQVVINIAADTVKIGRMASAHSLGMVLEGPVNNLAGEGRLLTGGSWTTGTSTFTAQSTGNNSPAGDYNAAGFEATNTQYSNFYQQAGFTGLNLTLGFWRKKKSHDNKRAKAVDTTAPTYTIETGTMSVDWAFNSISKSVVSGNTAQAMLVEGRAVGYAGAEAASGWFDFVQVESGNIAHEYHGGTPRLGSSYALSSAALSGGRLGLYMRFRPKGSIGGTNDWTYNPRLFYFDANNYGFINATTGVIAIVINSVSYSTTAGLTWNRGDLIELWIAVGGVTGTRIFARRNSASTDYITSKDISAWTLGGVAVVGSQVAPDGTLGAYKITEDTSMGLHRAYTSVSTVGTTRAVIKAKYVDCPYIRIADSGTTNSVSVNVQTGVITATTGSVYATVERSGDGWCTITLTGPIASGFYIYMMDAAGSTASYTGTSRSVLVYNPVCTALTNQGSTLTHIASVPNLSVGIGCVPPTVTTSQLEAVYEQVTTYSAGQMPDWVRSA
jgi:hypothetical protein